MRKHILLFLLSPLVSVLGCMHTNAYLGTTVEVDRQLEFYFKAGESKYIFDASLLQLMGSGAEWDVPWGTIVESPNIVASPASISWESNRKKYTVEGYRIHATCRMKIEPYAPTGSMALKLKLPFIKRIADQTSTTPKISGWYKGDFENGVSLESFEIHSSWFMQQVKSFIILAVLTVPPLIPLLRILRKSFAVTAVDLPESLAPTAGEEATAILRRFEPVAWENGIQASIDEFQAALEQEPGNVSEAMRNQLLRIKAVIPALATLCREAAIDSMKTGEVCSLLAAVDGNRIYIVVFPELATRAQQIQTYEEFAEGWISHSARVFRSLQTKTTPQPLMCVLIFLSPNAKGNQISYAYEASDGRIASAELVESWHADDGRPLVAIQKGNCQLIAPS